jgi:hypothetical protein
MAANQPEWDRKKRTFELDLLEVAQSLQKPASPRVGDWKTRLLGARFKAWKRGEELPPLPAEDVSQLLANPLSEVFTEWLAYEEALTKREALDEE